MSTTEYGTITMEGAKKLTNVFIPQGPVDVLNSKQICESCNQFEIGGKEYALIDISKKNHLRHWWRTKICWKCNRCGYVSWQNSEASYLKDQFNLQ